MKLAILDDYQNVAMAYGDWDKLRARGVKVTAFDRHLGAPDAAAKALAPFDALLLMRERQHFPKALIDQLPKLKFVDQFAMDIITSSPEEFADFQRKEQAIWGKTIREKNLKPE